jgi:uncharacterized protein (TIGR02453 family)
MLSKEAVKFIDDLAQNNSTEWMHANKKRYEAYKKDYHNYIGLVLTEMKRLDPRLENLEVKKCTFRINRDIRFSKNKQPYKTNIGLWFPTNSTKNAPGYYLHFEKGNSFVAGGVYCPENTELKKIRKEIEFFYDDLNEILSEKKFIEQYKTLSVDENNKLKKAPKDFDCNHPAIELLKFKSFTTSQKIDDKLFFQPDFSKKIAQKMIVLKPLNDYLNRALETED